MAENLNGRIIERREDGSFSSVVLDPEEAKRMQSERWAKKPRESKEALLREAGFPDDTQAPEHLRTLADIAVSQRAGAVPAMTAFLKLTRPDLYRGDNDNGLPKVRDNELCPCCGQVKMPAITIEELAVMQDLLQEMRKSQQGDA